MTPEECKAKLLKLHECAEAFSVIFSGKKSKKANGLYLTDKREIIIHNRNFGNDEAGEHLLIYTAIHELTHHIQFTELNQKSVRAHTPLFYATLDDLVDVAENAGIYQMPIDEDIQKLIDEAKDIDREMAALQRKLGQVLGQLHETCEKKGVRYEDVIARKAQISRKIEKKAKKAHALNLPEGTSADIQEAAIEERDKEKAAAIVRAGQEGKSINQAKKAAGRPVEPEDEMVRLMREKARIERTMASLGRRLEELNEQIQAKEEE
jgi:hypothetical protein